MKDENKSLEELEKAAQRAIGAIGLTFMLVGLVLLALVIFLPPI